MLLRLLLIAAVVLIVLQWRRKLRLDAQTARAAAAQRAAEPVAMLACAECGVHLPRSDAVIVDGAAGPVYCSKAHRTAHLLRERR